MIISVHIPRTGGTSFRKFLKDHFQDKLYEDNRNPILVKSVIKNTFAYSMGIVNTMYPQKFNKFDCIHGHFLPNKYRVFHGRQDSHFIIWVRDPIERLMSHYKFIIQRATAKHNKSPFQIKVYNEKWTFESFCFCEEMQDFMSNFLWKFPLENFDFIGDIEHINEDIAFFSEKYLTNYSNDIPHVNTTSKNNSLLIDFSQDDISKIQKWHSTDFQFYHDALLRRKEQRKII